MKILECANMLIKYHIIYNHIHKFLMHPKFRNMLLCMIIWNQHTYPRHVPTPYDPKLKLISHLLIVDHGPLLHRLRLQLIASNCMEPRKSESPNTEMVGL